MTYCRSKKEGKAKEEMVTARGVGYENNEDKRLKTERTGKKMTERKFVEAKAQKGCRAKEEK